MSSAQVPIVAARPTSQAERRFALLLASAAVALIVAALAAPAPAAAAAGERCWKPSAKSRTLPGGAKLKVPRASVSSKRARICVVRKGKRPSNATFRSTDTGKPWSLRVRKGDLIGPATLTVPFNPGAKGLRRGGLTAADLASVGFYDSASNTWLPVETTVDVKRKRLTATLTHFSFWDDLWMQASETSLSVNQKAGEWTSQRAAPPVCASGVAAPKWAVVTTNAGDELPIRTCAEGTTDDRVVVQIVNNRPYGMVLRYGTSVNFGWHDVPSGTGGLVSAIVDPMMGPGELYLPPLTRASVGIARGAFGFAQFQTHVNGESLVGDAIGLAIDGVPGLDGIATRVNKAALGEALTACGAGFIKPGLDGDVVTISADSDFISNLGRGAECAEKIFFKLIAARAFDKVKVDKVQGRLKLLKTLQKGIKAAAVAQFTAALATLLRDTQFNLMGANASFSVRSKLQRPATHVLYGVWDRATQRRTLVAAPMDNPRQQTAIASYATGEFTGVDAAQDRAYWTVAYGADAGIYSGRLDGTDVRRLAEPLPEIDGWSPSMSAGAILDDYYYWYEDHAISRVSLDGSKVERQVLRPPLIPLSWDPTSVDISEWAGY